MKMTYILENPTAQEYFDYDFCASGVLFQCSLDGVPITVPATRVNTKYPSSLFVGPVTLPPRRDVSRNKLLLNCTVTQKNYTPASTSVITF